jgi:hypothetical protein
MCVSIFSTTFFWNIFHSKKNWARYDQKRMLIFMYSTLYSCPILRKLEFSRQIFEKNTQISNFMKIRPAGAELFRGDRWTDMTKLTVPYRSFANAHKNGRGIIPAKPGRNSMYHLTGRWNLSSSGHTVYLRVSNDSHSNQLLYSRRAALSSNTVRVTSEDGPQFLIQINRCLQMVSMPCINQTLIKSYCQCKFVDDALCDVSWNFYDSLVSGTYFQQLFTAFTAHD